MNPRPADHSKEAQPIVLDERTAPEILKSLPFFPRRALATLIDLPRGELLLQLPDGRRLLSRGREAGPKGELILHNWRLPRRALLGGTIGVAESYVDGDWDSPDIADFLEVFLANSDLEAEIQGHASNFLKLIQRMRHWLNDNTAAGSKRNISAHYDLGNAFYEQWLDETMTYSSALYETGANDLASAQRAKYDALIEAAQIGPNDHVLEIGCGWGGFAERAASTTGCRVTALTISREQHDYARKRIDDAGLSDRVDIQFRDYRDEVGRYDRIVSIEMFEAVGMRWWSVFFDKLSKCLKPGGLAAMQVITITDRVFEDYRTNPDFIQRYVFPGGMLPTTQHLRDYGRRAGLDVHSDRAFGRDYARTLREWRERFDARWQSIAPLGFDERFRRLWRFYYDYCDAGFRTSNIDVHQIVYSR